MNKQELKEHLERFNEDLEAYEEKHEKLMEDIQENQVELSNSLQKVVKFLHDEFLNKDEQSELTAKNISIKLLKDRKQELKVENEKLKK